jgi:hypothetical protein
VSGSRHGDWNSPGPRTKWPEGRDFQELPVGPGEREAERGAENLLDIARALGVSIDFLMTGEASEKPVTEVPIPASLARFAAEERLWFRQTLMLLDMQKQIVAHRSAKKKDGLEGVDWRKFYEGVKEFLEGE